MPDSLNLLLVEDDPRDAELIVDQLGLSGFSVASQRVCSEQELEAALQREWDVVLADFRLPGFDGTKAFSVCRQKAKDVPFIFVSGLSEGGAVDAMRACGCTRVPKDRLSDLGPVVRSEVRRSVAAAQARWGEEHFREHRRLSMAVEISRAGILEHHVPLDAHTFCSERWASTLGYEPGELSARLGDVDWLGHLIHPEDSGEVQRRYEEFLSGARDRCELHLRVRHRDGHFVPVAAFFGALARDQDRCARHVVGLLIDLTNRDAREARRRQAQKMSAVGRLAGGIAHDFNNLLTAIIGLSSFAIEDLGPEHTSYESLQSVLGAGDQARSLTAQLLAFARRRPVWPRPVSLEEVVERLSSTLRVNLGPAIDLEVAIPPDTWRVHVDPGALEEVVLALVANAREAMPSGGQVSLSSRNVRYSQGDHEPGPDGSDLPPGDYVVLDVTDTGAGIEEELQDEIFEPFFTTKSRGWATGLGLSTAYGLLAQAGGCLTVKSRPGSGATFSALMRRANAPSDRPREPRESNLAAGRQRILVVDDNAVVRQTVVRSLSRAGYEVLSAGSGAEAIDVMSRVAGGVDLLLTDVVMPEMRGDELVDELLRAHPTLEVLYMSGYADATEVGGVRPPRPDNTLYKPFTPDELVKRVGSSVRESQVEF